MQWSSLRHCISIPTTLDNRDYDYDADKHQKKQSRNHAGDDRACDAAVRTIACACKYTVPNIVTPKLISVSALHNSST